MGETSDFDAERADSHLRAVLSFGSRAAGSRGVENARNYIRKELRSYGLDLAEDAFVAGTPKGLFPMVNLIAWKPGRVSKMVLIGGHYDTKHQAGFVGANDGGSSTAALLELARALSRSDPEYTLGFVFFDGEEAFIDRKAMNGLDNNYGSRHLVARWREEGTLPGVAALILLDMVGHHHPVFKRDLNSTRWLVDLVWETAQEAGRAGLFSDNEGTCHDDHIPFKNAGVPVVNIADLSYVYWHRNEDTLDKVSGKNIKNVADVVLCALPKIFKRLAAGA